MKKNILKFILFFTIILIIMFILSRIFIPKNNTKKAGMKENGITDILGEKENTIDLIMFGDSESITSVIPMKLWEDYGYTTFICGKPGQVLPDTLKVMYDTSKKQKPKAIVLETNLIYNDVSITVPLGRIVQEILPITEYHDRWKNLKLDDFNPNIKYTKTSHMKGFHYRTTIVPADSTGYMAYTDEIQDISKINKLYLNIVNEYCKKNDIKMMLMSAPSTKNWNYAKHNAVVKYAQEEQIEYLDLNMITDELNIDWNNDTLDGGDHMNYYGSVKLTDYFGKYLSDKGILDSHKDDKYYSNWNDDLLKYKEEIERESKDKDKEKGKIKDPNRDKKEDTVN